MRGDVGLNVKGVLFGVKTAGDVEREGLISTAAKLRGHLTNGDRVLVDDAVEAFILLGVDGEVLDRSEVVSNRKVSARLNAGVGNGSVVNHFLLPLLNFISVWVIVIFRNIKYNKIRFFGGFASEKTPLRRAMRACAPRGAVKIKDFDKRR